MVAPLLVLLSPGQSCSLDDSIPCTPGEKAVLKSFYFECHLFSVRTRTDEITHITDITVRAPDLCCRGPRLDFEISVQENLCPGG